MARDKFYRVADVPVTELLLDTNNPRIRHGEDQNDCIARILRDRDNFVNLLKDVAAEGLSPEHVLVSKNAEGKWVVRDGNRRLTVLKLLNQPELAQPDQRLEQLIRRVAESANGKIPKRIECIACDDEAEIVAYLERKHTGENAGVGQRNWSALLKSLFNLHSGISDANRRATQLVLWVEGQNMRVEDDFPITTLNRGLTGETLRLIGFDVRDDELTPILPIPQAYALAARVISDVMSGRVNVQRDGSEGSWYSASEQLAYFKRIRAEIGPWGDDDDSGGPSAEPFEPNANHSSPSHEGGAPAPSEKTLVTVGRPENSHEAESRAENIGPPPTTGGRLPSAPKTAPWQRTYLFGNRRNSSPGFSVPSSEKKVQQIVVELRNLSVIDHPLAVTMLMRVLLELSDTFYRERNALSRKDSLRENIAASADHMKEGQRLTKQQHRAVLTQTRGEAGLLHVTTIQALVHERTFHPTQQNVNTTWDELACFVAACWR